MKVKTRSRVGLILRITVSLLALGGLLYALRGKLGEAFLLMHQGFRLDWFCLALVLNFLGLALISWRLQLVFRVQHVCVNFPQAFYLNFLALFFNLFFPSALGGDVAKGYFAYQYSGKKLGTFTGIFLDRLLGFGTWVSIAVVATAIYSRRFAEPWLEGSVYGLLGFLVLGVLFFSNRPFARRFGFLSRLLPSANWREKLSDLYEAIREYKNHKGLVLRCLALSLLAQVLFLVDGYILAKALEIPIALWPFFILIPLVSFVSMAPSLSGLGVREAGFVFLFKPFIPVEQAFALSLLYDILFYGSAVAAGVLFAFRGGLRKEVIHDLEKAEELEEVGR